VLSPCWSEDAERSTTSVWSEALRYGTDTEVLETLARIQDASERSLDGELARLLGQSRNDDVRSRILEILGGSASAAGADEALAILESEEPPPGLLRAAVGYLARVKEKRALVGLERLVRGSDEITAAAAASAIGAIGERASASGLLEVLRDAKVDLRPTVRNQIILALGGLGDVGAADLLIDIAGNRDLERITRMYAMSSLGKLGELRAVPVLSAALSESDALLRTYAAAALGRLRAPGFPAALLQLLRDSSWQVRVEAAKAVADGAAGDEAGEELVKMLQYRARRDDVAQVRREAIRALGTLGGAASLDLLRELYTDSRQSLEIRKAALVELLRADLSSSLPAITKVVDEEWGAKPDRQKALEATAEQLSRTDSKDLDALYRRFLDSGNLSVRISGIRGIARNDLVGAAEGLYRAAAAGQTSVRREALAAIEKLGLEAP
jgi:HEAT repeat protein